MKTKRKVKARKMWANYYEDGIPMIHATLDKARDAGPYAFNRQSVFVLPADAASYDAMVEQAAEKIYWSEGGRLWWPTHSFAPEFRKKARAAISAIGITRPAKTRK